MVSVVPFIVKCLKLIEKPIGVSSDMVLKKKVLEK